jgi:hypothetical protein
LRAVFIEKWKISLIAVACCLIIGSVLGLYFHSGESFSLDFSDAKIKDIIPLKKGDELKFYFKVPEDGFSGLDIRIKPIQKASIFSIQLILRKLYKQTVVTQEIISSDKVSRDGFLPLRFCSLTFSRGSEFELAISTPESVPDANLELVVLAPNNNIQSLPTIYNTSVVDGTLSLKLYFASPLFIWRLLLNNAFIPLILTTILSLLVFKVLSEKYRYPWAIIYFSIVLMFPTYVIISPDDEGLYNSLMGAILKSRALAEGNLPFWDSFHGIGMPYNTMSSINWHPIWLLLDKVPLSVLVPILYHLHVLIALFSMFALARLIGLHRPTALLCAITYSCSTQSITYIFGKNFWPAGMIPITLMPTILFFLIKFLYAEGPGKKFLYSLLTGSCVGFMILNTHLGMVLFLAMGLSFYLAMNWRRLIASWPWVLLLGCLILLIGAARLVDMFEEIARYPEPANYVPHFENLDFWGLLLWPLKKIERGLAFGGPFFLLSLIGIFWPGLKNVNRTAFGVSIIGCYAIFFVPINFLLPANYGTSHFIIIFSVLLAGLVADQLWSSLRGRVRWGIIILCLLQAFVVMTGAGNYWERNARYAIDYVQNKKVAVLKVVFNTSPLTRAIEKFDKGQGGRSYFAHEAAKTLMRKLIFGYHFESLPLNGFRILNGKFNGIEYSDIYPNRSYMKAHVVGLKKIVFNQPLLDVLGIKYIFADSNEPVPSGLVRSELLPAENDQIIAMYTNPTAWPDAVVVNDDAKSLQPPPERGQNNRGLLFYDFRPLLGLRIMEDPVKTKRYHGSIILMLEPSSKRRTVMVSEYFRPGWKAKWRSSEGLIETTVFPIFGHLVGIEVPSSAVEIHLSYIPAMSLVLWFIAIATVFLSLSGAFIIWVWSVRQGLDPELTAK